MSNFLTRAKALAYDTHELMKDMSDMRKALVTDEYELAQAGKSVDHSERKAELGRSFDALSDALRAIERVIVNEYQTDDVELPDFLPETGGQG